MNLERYRAEILLHTGEHLVLVAIATIVAISIGIPLGILITRQPKFAGLILGIANALQTIPSLAIFGFLISVPFLGGIGKVPAIVALTLYALLPIIRNTYIGINNVDPAIREAGKGMGMTDWQLLSRVEFPLAAGVILAGVRVATVISVGVATIGAAIGGGGLGVFIFRGIASVNNELILAGAIPAAAIALIADFALGWLEQRLSEPQERQYKNNRLVAIILGLLALILVGLGILNYQQAPATITIGSKNFTEQVILGELIAQQIESQTNLKVDRRFNLGGTYICHEAVKTGKIDGYVEYTGTSLTDILKQRPISDARIVFDRVKQEYAQKFKLAVLPSLGFENTFAMMIRSKDAQKFKINTLSEVAKYTPQWQAGFGYEFLERADGYPGLAKTYGLNFANPPKQMELGLIYKALADKKIDFTAGNSTEGLVSVLKLMILADDKKYFPPYQAVPIFNQATLTKYPGLQPVIERLTDLISTQEMQKMNYLVDTRSDSVEQIVRDFLKSKS